MTWIGLARPVSPLHVSIIADHVEADMMPCSALTKASPTFATNDINPIKKFATDIAV
jgi:hypothetical protein